MTANDASFPERATAYDVAYIMKAKAKIGMGMSNTEYAQFPAVKGITKPNNFLGCSWEINKT